MHWTVVAPFNQKYTDSDWLSPYVPRDRHEFSFIPRPGQNVNWHLKKVPVTTRKEWLGYWQQTSEALVERQERQGGIVTVFPQLSALVALRKRFSGERFPLVSWWFNTVGYTGVKQRLAQWSFQAVDRFVVHTRSEADYYSQWLKIPKARFEFVPLQKAEMPRIYAEEQENPFLFATGSGYRDYGTFFEAVEKLNLPTIVAPGRHAVAGLTIPSQVDLRFEITKPEIYRCNQQARINVIPMSTEGATAGTVTIVEAMRMGCAIIATRRSGVEDYIEHGKTGLLVEPYSTSALTEAIDRLWNDAELRNRLGKAAYQFAAEHCSDEAAGAHLSRILSAIEGEKSQSRFACQPV